MRCGAVWRDRARDGMDYAGHSQFVVPAFAGTAVGMVRDTPYPFGGASGCTISWNGGSASQRAAWALSAG